jgi:hypothetical protein
MRGTLDRACDPWAAHRQLDAGLGHASNPWGVVSHSKEVPVADRLCALAAFMLCVVLAVGCGPRGAQGPGDAAAAGDSSAGNTNPDSSAGGTQPRGTSSPLAGTWAGNLRADTGEELPAVFKVAASGNPIYEYATKSGAREVELTAVGQSLRFVPPEGGVANVMVDSLTVSPQRIVFSMSLSGERTSLYGSEGTLSQSRGSILCEASLAGAEVDLQMTVGSSTTFSQPGEVVPGDEQRVVLRGKLRRQ